MCNSNAPTSTIEQGIVVRCHSGSFLSNGLEKKTTNHARSRNSSVALKPSVCEKEYLVRLAIPQDGRKKDLTRKTWFCGLSCFVWLVLVSIGFNLRLVSIYSLFLRADVSTACPAPVGFNLRFDCESASLGGLPMRARAGGRRHAEGCKYSEWFGCNPPYSSAHPKWTTGIWRQGSSFHQKEMPLST